jgi:hypothetical protein
MATFRKEGAELWSELCFPDLSLREVPQREPCICEELSECICAELLDEYQVNEVASPTKNPDAIIPLPSTMSELPPEWLDAAEVEENLRVAQCHEALEELRNLIARKSHLYREKRSISSGQRRNMKSYDRISKLENSMRLEVKRYDLGRGSLIRLNALGRHLELLELRREHTKAIVSIFDPNARQQSKAKLSWIWTVAIGKVDTDDQYVEDSECTLFPFELKLHW